MESKEKINLIKAWMRSAEEDWRVANSLFKLQHYSYSLFFCHLTIEKILKAIYLKNNNRYPLPIHKLARLAKDAKIKLTGKQTDHLNEMTTFNIEARYDVIKEKLYKKATKQFTEKYLKITLELFDFLKTQL